KPAGLANRSPTPREETAPLLAKVADGLILKRSTGTVTFPAEPYRGQITLTDPQFLAGGELQPIITGPDGTLVGELASDGGRLWILSDPDLLSNQGIGKADNAAVAVALIDRLQRGTAGPV